MKVISSPGAVTGAVSKDSAGFKVSSEFEFAVLKKHASGICFVFRVTKILCIDIKLELESYINVLTNN